MGLFLPFLKLYREVAYFDSAGRLFHSLAPLYGKHFWPLDDLFIGNLKSVPAFRSLYDEHSDFRMKRAHRYRGASSFRDLSEQAPRYLCDQDVLTFSP